MKRNIIKKWKKNYIIRKTMQNQIIPQQEIIYKMNKKYQWEI